MIEPSERTADVPAWVAVLVVVICLVGGAAVVWWFWTGSQPQVVAIEVAPQEQPQRPQRARAPRPARQAPAPAPAPQRQSIVTTPADAPDGIEQLRDNVFRVKSGRSTMHITIREGDDRYRFAYAGDDLRDDQARELDTVRWRVLRDRAMAEATGLNEEHIEQLRQVPGITMQLSGGDRRRLIELWQQYQQAEGRARSEAESNLRQMLGEVGERSWPATEQFVQQRTEQLRAILTEPRLESFRSTG